MLWVFGGQSGNRPAGTWHLTASYSGSAARTMVAVYGASSDFTGSAFARKTLKVVT